MLMNIWMLVEHPTMSPTRDRAICPSGHRAKRRRRGRQALSIPSNARNPQALQDRDLALPKPVTQFSQVPIEKMLPMEKGEHRRPSNSQFLQGPYDARVPPGELQAFI